jgi:hypothetical protein
MIWQPSTSIWTPPTIGPLDIPLSPPAERRRRAEREIDRDTRALRYRDLCPGAWQERYECVRPVARRRAMSPAAAASGPPTASLVASWMADKQVYNDAGTTLATNTQTVQQWNDQSGSGQNLSQATSGSRPQFLTGQQNGLPGVKLAGAKGIAGALTSAMSNGTVFMVMNWHTDSSGQAQWGAGSAVAGSYIIDILTLGAPSIFVRDHGNNDVVTGPAVGAWAILAFGTGNSGAGFYRKNAGSLVATSTGDLANQWVGCALGTTGTASWTFGEVLIYSGILGTTAETAVRNYLNGKWAIF